MTTYIVDAVRYSGGRASEFRWARFDGVTCRPLRSFEVVPARIVAQALQEGDTVAVGERDGEQWRLRRRLELIRASDGGIEIGTWRWVGKGERLEDLQRF